MNSLLVVAYYFPPSGGPGVQRVLKHVNYLRDFGWKPVVLTVENGQFPAFDESLLKQIPTDIEVCRTKIFEPYDIYRMFTGKKPGTAIDVNTIKKDGAKLSVKEAIAELIRATFFIPDARVGWLYSARKAALELVAKHNCKAVYSSSPPYTCSLIARYAHKKAGIPWIAGFRDPWTGFISSPNRWFLPAAIDRYLEKSVFTDANYVECAWEGIIKDALGKYPELNKDKFIHVPNGFDSNDFPSIEQVRNEKFTVTYTGSMYGRRNPAEFFRAVENLIDKKLINPDELHLRFVGRFGAEVEQMFDNAIFRKQIEVIGYVAHQKSIEYLMKSDALLLVVDEAKDSEEIVPGKVYEYIGVRKPIIAIAPKTSAIAKLLVETGSGEIAHQSEIEEIQNIVLRYYNNWKNNTTVFAPDENKISSYERRNAAKKLAELLDSTL